MNELRPTSLGRATAWRFAYLLSQAGLGLVLFIVLAQVLDPDAFAIAALAQAVLVIAQALGDFGLSQAAVTVIPARLAREPGSRARVMKGAARAFGLAAIAALVLGTVAAALVPASARLATLLVAPAAAASVVVSGADGLLRAQGEFRRPVALVTLSRLGAFLAVPAAVITDSAAWASLGLSVGVVLATLPAGRILVKSHRASSDGDASEMLRAAGLLGTAQIFIIAAGRLNTVILGSLISVRAAAAFEGAWRLFQLGQYAAGGLATAAAPIIGAAVGGGPDSELRSVLRKLTLALGAGGVMYGALLLFAGPRVSPLLLGEVGEDVADVLLPFALLSPLAFLGFLAMVTLAASPADRKSVPLAYLFGSVLSIGLVLLLSESHGLAGATAGCGIGWGVAQLLLIRRLVPFLRNAKVHPVARPASSGTVE
jgi:O-antigen/teichoic acid export membrane protein